MTMPARRTAASGYDTARYSLDIQDGGQRYPLPDGYMGQLRDVTLDQVWDGADELQLTFDALDPERNLRVIGERILEPGTSVIFRAGYGKSLHTLGRFTIGAHEPNFGPETATVLLRGTDGFRRLMDDSWPGVWGHARTWARLAEGVAEKYGMGFVGDESVPIPHKTRTRRTRKGRKKGRRTSTVKTHIVKNAGDTDANMLKMVAGYAGFMHPKVRYLDANSPLARQVAQDHQLVARLDGRDVLFFRVADLQRQARELPGLEFVYRYKDGRPATLDTFTPVWDTDEVPVAVRVSGIVGQGKGRKVLTVEAELVGPEQYRRRSSLQREAARQVDPARKELLQAQADALSSQVTFTRISYTKARKQDRKQFENAEKALIEVLENERKAGLAVDWQANDPRRKRKVQTMRREVVRMVGVYRNGAQIEQVARAWLLSRLQLHQTASASSSNMPGLELVYPQQVHPFSRISPEYDGLWMVMKANHRWTPDGHGCSMALERVAEAPSQLRTQARSTER